MIFYRILDNKLYQSGEVNRLGFEESEGYRIPDEYLEQREFTVMRTCHGLGDWGIISAMPRLFFFFYAKTISVLPIPFLLRPDHF